MLGTPTFRDPDGFCLQLDNRFYRFVAPGSQDRVVELLKSSFIAELLAEGCIPKTRILAPDEAERLHKLIANSLELVAYEKGLVLEHEAIPFPSYAHEWCPEMLYVAGELTLSLQQRALEEGYTLKDATPTNILFRGSQPVFVDILSFLPREKGSTLWIAYAQFVRNFLLPLYLSTRRHQSLQDIFMNRRDGVEPEEVYRQLPLYSKFGRIALQYVSLPRWLGGPYPSAITRKSRPPAKNDADALAISQMLLRGLARSFKKLKPNTRRLTAWSNYMEQKSYDDQSFQHKEDFVIRSLKDFGAKTVLDIGCNTGHFSVLAGALGAKVVAIDYDPVVIGQLFNRCSETKKSIFPLVMSLTRPSPGLGWANSEQSPFLSRIKGQIDVCLLLAVVHHITVTDGIPLKNLFRLLSEIVTKGLVVEFVPPSDPMFQTICTNKEHLIPLLGQSEFESSFSTLFKVTKKIQLTHSERFLYELVKHSS